MQLHRQLSAIVSCLSLAAFVLSDSLPNYTGQYGVGTVDIEVPVASPRNVTDTTFKSNGQAAFQLQTVFFTLYYPIENGTRSSKPHHMWLPGDINQTAQGIATATNGTIDPSLIVLGFNALAGNLSIPAEVDTPLVDGTSKFPVIVFSHGDTSLPSWYSQWNGEMASRGYVTVVMEHRDGTAPATQVEIKNEPTRNITGFTVAQVNPQMNNTEFKLRQLQMRQAELEAIMQVIETINDGSGNAVYQNSSRGEGGDLGSWKGRLDLDHFLVAGHSFGSNLALQALNGAPSSDVPATAAITFDPGKDSGPLNTNVTVPIAILDSEEWSATPNEFYGRQHFEVVKSIAQTSLDATNEAYFATLLGTTHPSITDAPLITTAFLSYFTDYKSNTTIDPRVAMDQYVTVSDDFLQFLVNGTRRGALASNVTDAEFSFLPNSTVQSDPWEFHITPASNTSSNSGGSNGSGSGSGNGLSGSSGSDTNAAPVLTPGSMAAVFCVLVAVAVS